MNSGRSFLILLGVVAALLIVGQLVLGQLILSGRVNLVKAHQHSGYTAVLVSLVYIVLSLKTLAKKS
jgi:heme A synthase